MLLQEPGQKTLYLGTRVWREGEFSWFFTWDSSKLFHNVLMIPNSKNDHEWPKVKADPMRDGYLINNSNYDPQIVKIREGLCTPESPFLEQVPPRSRGVKFPIPESEVQRHFCLFTTKTLYPSRLSISTSCLLPWASCNKNRTSVNVLDTLFIWWKTFTSLEAKCILNSNVVLVKKHTVPYILPSSQLIIYTPCRGTWYSLRNIKAHCVSQRTHSKYRQGEQGQRKKYLGRNLWWTGLERQEVMDKETELEGTKGARETRVKSG